MGTSEDVVDGHLTFERRISDVFKLKVVLNVRNSKIEIKIRVLSECSINLVTLVTLIDDRM